MQAVRFILNWNPQHGVDHNIPCGTVRVVGWHIKAIDLVFAVCQPADIRIDIASFPNAIKLLMGKGSTSRHSKAASEAMCAVREMDWIFGVDPIRICICRSNHYLHTFEASSPIFGDLFTELTKILICDHSTQITRTEN